MFCNQCGKEISEKSRFCSYCGSEQTPVTASQPQSKSSVKPSPPISAKKLSKGKTIAIFAAIIAVPIIIAAVANGSDGKIIKPVSPIEQTTFDFGLDNIPEIGTVATDEINGTTSDYEKLLSKYIYYIDIENPFFSLNCNSYAKEESDILHIVKYGYEDDLVKEINQVYIADISSMSDSERAKLDQSVRAEYDKYYIEGCCTIKYSESINYYTITVSLENLDNSDNLKKLTDTGYFNFVVTDDTYVSMKMSEERILDNGFVKR